MAQSSKKKKMSSIPPQKKSKKPQSGNGLKKLTKFAKKAVEVTGKAVTMTGKGLKAAGSGIKQGLEAHAEWVAQGNLKAAQRQRELEEKVYGRGGRAPGQDDEFIDDMSEFERQPVIRTSGKQKVVKVITDIPPPEDELEEGDLAEPIEEEPVVRRVRSPVQRPRRGYPDEEPQFNEQRFEEPMPQQSRGRQTSYRPPRSPVYRPPPPPIPNFYGGIRQGQQSPTVDDLLGITAVREQSPETVARAVDDSAILMASIFGTGTPQRESPKEVSRKTARIAASTDLTMNIMGVPEQRIDPRATVRRASDIMGSADLALTMMGAGGSRQPRPTAKHGTNKKYGKNRR